MDFFPDSVEFDWDNGNRDKNWRRHRVKWSECEEVFFNIPLLLLPDIEHSLTEERDYAFGRTNSNRLLVVVFTMRKNKIRVISARDMTKKEKGFYYEKTQKPS